MSSACGIRREPGTRMLCHTIYLQVVKVHWFNYSICWVSNVHSSRSLHFRSSFRKPKSFRSLSICANATVTQELKQLDILYKDLHHETFEIRRRVPRVEKLTKFKKNTYLSLSLLFDPPMHCPKGCACTTQFLSLFLSFSLSLSLSLSLYLHLQKHFGSRSDPNGISGKNVSSI